METQSGSFKNNAPSSSSVLKIKTGNNIKTYRDTSDFLSKHVHQKDLPTTNPKPVTNTRIGDPKQSIHGGSYHIPDEEYGQFLDLYAKDVIVGKKKEYLTEMQRENDGPILVDIDFRYDYEIDEKQHSPDDIVELIGEYLGEIKNIFQLDDSTRFQIFVFEKPQVNRIDDKVKNKKITKDGIHMIIGLQADHVTQQILREKIIDKAAEIWKNLPLKNTFEDVFDKGISTGKTPWQLYGSRKPSHDRYQLTRIFDVSYDPSDEQFMYPESPVSSFDIVKNIRKLSVRNKENPSLFMTSNFIKEYENYKKDKNIGKSMAGGSLSMTLSKTNLDIYNDDFLHPSNIAKIRSREELERAVNNFLDSIQISDYNLRETHQYAMILPASYYGDGSYEKWIRVGWALKNTDARLLITWIAFCARSPTFHFSEVSDRVEKWLGFETRKVNGLSKRSLLHWAKADAPKDYERVRHDTIDYFLEETIRTRGASTSKHDDRSGCGDTDIAKVLFELFKHQYVCVSIKGNVWYQYINNRWQEVDSGTTLRKAISEQLRDLYNQKTFTAMNSMILNGEPNEHQTPEEDPTKRRSIRILNICTRLSDSNGKDKIMKEARELFYDGTFLQKMDTNPYFLCFKNGVIDFKEKVFRKGHPEDNISMCTNIDYIPLNIKDHGKIMDEINDFMNKLFPEKELCDYMWDHLSSTLIGTASNQTFNMYIGIGQNGKSVLVNLMEMVLGDYKGDVPLTLVTEKRGKVGGLTPEIVELKGIRYAVMAEPQKGDKINEGMMKTLTSGKDRLQGRAPYMPQTISFLPQFKLVVTCNVFMEVKSNDHGTWRRIRAVPFKSLFTKNPVNDDKEKPFQFMLDEYIDEKFDSWKEVFAAMLVKRAFETGGLVKDCNIVMAKSNEYRQSQDYISEFVGDRIKPYANGRIKKMELNSEFTIWHGSNYGGRCPGPKDLHEYMDKTFGKQRAQAWHGVKIVYDRDNNAHESIDSDYPDDIDDNELVN
uniref:SF3 helicase domain-containing protein n=1 Tax=viral metagenome TaxID=1070528 RepID=A0A6C0JE41_9ZZZZ